VRLRIDVYAASVLKSFLSKTDSTMAKYSSVFLAHTKLSIKVPLQLGATSNQAFKSLENSTASAINFNFDVLMFRATPLLFTDESKQAKNS